MGIIKAVKLAFDYLKYDEDGNVQETQRAVDGVDIDIKEGQFVAILGHNGSGKSTFLRCLNLLENPESGKIYFEGDEITGNLTREEKQLIKERLQKEIDSRPKGVNKKNSAESNWQINHFLHILHLFYICRTGSGENSPLRSENIIP